MYVRGYLQGSENGRVVTIGKCVLRISILPLFTIVFRNCSDSVVFFCFLCICACYIKVLFRDLKLYKWPCIPIEIHDIILDLTHTDPNERASISLAKTKLELFTKQHESRNQG